MGAAKKRVPTGETFSCWIGNPTMVWKARQGFHTHILSAGMKYPDHQKLSKQDVKTMALKEARNYARQHKIKCFVLHCCGDTIVDSNF